MKNNIILRLACILVALSLFTTCENDMEKAQDDYSAAKVVPIVISTNGPTQALQTKIYEFKITYFRSGSTWNWTATEATVDSVSADKRTAFILFDQKPANDTALIKVTETTSGGVTSAQKVFEVKVDPFCPMEITDFVGTWNVIESGDEPDTSTVSIIQGAGTDNLVLQVNAGRPGLLGAVFDGWGEAFQTSVVPKGNITMHVNLDNGLVTIPFAYWGQTLPGPYDYWIFGDGTWSGCGAKPTITINSINLDWDGSQTAQYTNAAVLTKQ
jgi:hypothetical protein